MKFIEAFAIEPYCLDGTWHFDDERVGLVREPFVGDINTMINLLVEDIPDARDGFRFVFADEWFPLADTELQWTGEEWGGNRYEWREKGLAGWLCPALYKYFDSAPRSIFLKVEARWDGFQRRLMGDLVAFIGAEDRGRWLLDRLEPYGPMKIGIEGTDRWNILLLPDAPVKRLMTAHFDRVDEIPGANDNSAACIEMLTAVEECWSRQCHTAICFTDLEERQNCAKYNSEEPALGAAALTNWFQANGGLPEERLVFDVSGLGRVLSASRRMPEHIARTASEYMKLDYVPHGLQGDDIAIPGSILFLVFPEDTEDGLMAYALLHSEDDTIEMLEAETVARMAKFMTRLVGSA